MLTVTVKRLRPDTLMPVKATRDSVCFDLHVCHTQADELGWVVYTGLAVALPPGYGMFLFPRSGLSSSLGLTLRNSTGVIDSDYRGEIIVKLERGHQHRYLQEILEALQPGKRIAQALIIQVPEVSLVEADTLPPTERGAGGFGSTGS